MAYLVIFSLKFELLHQYLVQKQKHIHFMDYFYVNKILWN
jgi:hypothetical protein